MDEVEPEEHPMVLNNRSYLWKKILTLAAIAAIIIFVVLFALRLRKSDTSVVSPTAVEQIVDRFGNKIGVVKQFSREFESYTFAYQPRPVLFQRGSLRIFGHVRTFEDLQVQ